MNLNLEINNLTKSPVGDGFFAIVAEKTFNEIGFDFLKNKNINVSVALVTSDEIRKINNEYRKYDNVTDILSFPEHETERELRKQVENKKEDDVFLGELILCYNDIKEYADKENLEPEKELAKVFSHGILHLLGFSHGKKMFALQDKVVNKIIIPD